MAEDGGLAGGMGVSAGCWRECGMIEYRFDGEFCSVGERTG